MAPHLPTPVFQRPLGSEYLWGDREDLAILRVPNTHLEGTQEKGGEKGSPVCFYTHQQAAQVG